MATLLLVSLSKQGMAIHDQHPYVNFWLTLQGYGKLVIVARLHVHDGCKVVKTIYTN